MGSISFEIDRTAVTKDEVLKYVRSVLPDATVLDHSFQSTPGSYEWGGVMYAAVRNDRGANAGEVWALIVLFSVRNAGGCRELCVKVLDETVGPGEDTMPLRILTKLSPTDHKFATQWRESVREFHQRRRAARAMIGRRIELASPLPYGAPVGEVSTVKVESMTRWRDPATGCVLRPPAQWWMRTFTAAA